MTGWFSMKGDRSKIAIWLSIRAISSRFTDGLVFTLPLSGPPLVSNPSMNRITFTKLSDNSMIE